jgi:hypothetical protein
LGKTAAVERNHGRALGVKSMIKAIISKIILVRLSMSEMSECEKMCSIDRI